MRIAFVGGGIAGLGAAYVLSRAYEVELYESEPMAGDWEIRPCAASSTLAAAELPKRHPWRGIPSPTATTSAMSFFELMLDPTITYSCAVFDDEPMPLEDARRRKLRRIAAKLEQDYCNHRGTYTKVGSIGMLEAIGGRQFGPFFAAIDRALLAYCVAALRLRPLRNVQLTFCRSYAG